MPFEFLSQRGLPQWSWGLPIPGSTSNSDVCYFEEFLTYLSSTSPAPQVQNPEPASAQARGLLRQVRLRPTGHISSNPGHRPITGPILQMQEVEEPAQCSRYGVWWKHRPQEENNPPLPHGGVLICWGCQNTVPPMGAAMAET